MPIFTDRLLILFMIFSERFLMLDGWLALTLMYNGLFSGLHSPVFIITITQRCHCHFVFWPESNLLSLVSQGGVTQSWKLVSLDCWKKIFLKSILRQNSSCYRFFFLSLFLWSGANRSRKLQASLYPDTHHCVFLKNGRL